MTNFGYDILTEKVDPKYEDLTDDAKILQSILSYSIDYGTESYFKSRKLSKNHLLKNCEHYKEIYKNSRTNYKNRPGNIDDTVVKLLGKLEYLDLVDSKSFKSQNKQVSKEYKFTKLGIMISLLLFCSRIKKNQYSHI